MRHFDEQALERDVYAYKYLHEPSVKEAVKVRYYDQYIRLYAEMFLKIRVWERSRAHRYQQYYQEYLRNTETPQSAMFRFGVNAPLVVFGYAFGTLFAMWLVFKYIVVPYILIPIAQGWALGAQ